MPATPAQVAHRRLEALARRRRAALTEPWPLPDSVRQRLQAEVARRTEAASRLPEPPPGPIAFWLRWRGFVGWSGLGLATIVLAWTAIHFAPRSPTEFARNEPVREPTGIALTAPPFADESAALSSASAESASSSPVRPVAEAMTATATATATASAPVSAPASARQNTLAPRAASPSPSRKTAAEPVAFSAPSSVPAPASAPAPAVDGPAAKPMSVRGAGGSSAVAAPSPLQASAVPLRRWYQRADGEEAPAVLRRFEVVRSGERVEVRDDDGTVYAGRLLRLEGDSHWGLEARGLNVRLGQTVVIQGRFQPPRSEGPADSRTVPSRQSEAFLELPFLGRVVIGSATNVFLIVASPVP